MISVKAVKYTGCICLLAAMFSIPLVTRQEYVLHILCLIGINIIFACSINAILSIGELNLAQAAFMGIGAYTSTIMVMRLHLAFWAAMPLAMIVTAIVSFLIGFLTLRFKGAYFLLFTFLFGELMRVLLSNFWVSLFGGIPGITNIPKPSIRIGTLVNVDFTSKTAFYYLVFFLVIFTVTALRRVERSRIGMIFAAIRQSDALVESIGISTMKFKVLGCAIGCLFAGLSGSLYAHFVGIITPSDFATHAVLAPIAYVVVGGMGNVFGPVIGTAALMTLSNFFLQRFGFFELLLYGIIIVLIIRFMPEGIISVPRSLVRMRSVRREAKVETYGAP